MEAKDVREAALALGVDERAELAAQLLASLDGEAEDDVERAWAAEVARRIRLLDAEGSSGRPWNELVEEIRQPK